jgi:hypothetical protein
VVLQPTEQHLPETSVNSLQEGGSTEADGADAPRFSAPVNTAELIRAAELNRKVWQQNFREK